MAGVAFLAYFKKQRVAVAIDINAFYSLNVSRCFALQPAFPTAPAEINHCAGLKRFGKGLPVHICDHKHFIGFGVLRNGGDQALIVEFNRIK